MSYASFTKSFPDLFKSFSEKMFQPTGIAVMASIGIHAALGVTLPYLPMNSQNKPPSRGTVQLVQLSPTEQSRLPQASPPPQLTNQLQSLYPLPPSLSTPYPSLSASSFPLNLSPVNPPSNGLARQMRSPSSLSSLSPDQKPSPAQKQSSAQKAQQTDQKYAFNNSTRMKPYTQRSATTTDVGRLTFPLRPATPLPPAYPPPPPPPLYPPAGGDLPIIQSGLTNPTPTASATPSPMPTASATPSPTSTPSEPTNQTAQSGSSNQTPGQSRPTNQTPTQSAANSQALEPPAAPKNPTQSLDTVAARPSEPGKPQQTAYNPAGTTLLEAVKKAADQQNANPNSKSLPPISLSINYPPEMSSCPKQEPSTASVNVTVKPDGTITPPELIQATGYDVLDRAALTKAQSYSFAEDTKGQTLIYQFRVGINRDSCQVKPAQSEPKPAQSEPKPTQPAPSSSPKG